MIRFAALHQFHPSTAFGDAITQNMLHLQDHFREMGYSSEIYAEDIAPGLEDRVRHIRSYEGSEHNLLFFHHSLGTELFDQVVDLPDEIVAVYHNLTPERYFDDERIKQLLRLGHEQLALLSRRARLGMTDSNYNRREMLAAGFRRPEVMPVRVDYTPFFRSPGDARVDSTDWLFVGRIVGNKCQHELVEAFAIYSKNFDPDARLVLVGDLSVTSYVEFVREEAKKFGVIDKVAMVGKVSDHHLVSAFAGAGVYVSMSEHEGFGVPVLEAMAAAVPVVAYGAAALPEVMGGAGILLRDKDPRLVAATVQSIREDAYMRERLIERQLVRVHKVQQFDVPAFLQRVVDRAGGEELPLEVQVQGPFETSYSLAVMNRQIACGLAEFPDRAVSIYATEGPGDYTPNAGDLLQHPGATKLFRRSRRVPYPDVVIRQMYPPRVIDSPGGITIECFGWEESLIPDNVADDFNRYLNGVGVMSHFVRQVLRDSGVDIPVRVMGVGVNAHDAMASVSAPELEQMKRIRFLHIGSAFARKGVDLLIDAYFSEFNGFDDTTLILKTFPNPHNEVASLLEEALERHSNPPDVRWIDRELDDQEMAGLYNLADCYVHPARGEGFGLPVAEAMAAGLPVITVSYSGLADFVSEETAVTIPYRIEAAHTHLSVPGSTWAEPDRESLAVEMRRIAEEPDAAYLKDKVERARELITTEYSWEAVSRRWDSFVGDLEEAAAVPNVAMVTTWNTRCGIAENTRNLLSSAGSSISTQIFADKGAVLIDGAAEAGVTRTWVNRWEPDLSELDDMLRLSSADVVHFQFNFGFFELKRLAELIERQLEQRGVVMTLHRTQDSEIEGEMVSLESIRSTLEKVDRLIVHQKIDARLLSKFGLKENVSVVPIGTAKPPKVSHVQARNILGLGERRVIGTFGFLLPHKGILELVRTVDSLRREFPDIFLLALCARYPAPASDEYRERVLAEISDRNMAEHVMLIDDYLHDDLTRVLLRGVDAIALPYRQTQESSSAAIRFVLPCERPLVVTDLEIFADCRDGVMTVPPEDQVALEDGLRRVLTDPDLRVDLSKKAAVVSRRFRWSRVAADHREIYGAARRAHRRRTKL